LHLIQWPFWLLPWSDDTTIDVASSSCRSDVAIFADRFCAIVNPLSVFWAALKVTEALELRLSE